MSEKKQKGKQAWCLNTVAILKPYIERKEHITRTTANRLVKPVTNWQRRELDTLRKQANQIIRGEDVSALTYGIFGMTLEHPDLVAFTASFDATIKQHHAPFHYPAELHIRGMQASEEKVFYDNQYHHRKAIIGDVWIIRREYSRTMDMLIVENEHTYVLIPDCVGKMIQQKTGYRCLYPECVKVADVEIIYPEVPDQPVGEPILPLTTSVATEQALPAVGEPGVLYNVRKPDGSVVQMMWLSERGWCCVESAITPNTASTAFVNATPAVQEAPSPSIPESAVATPPHIVQAHPVVVKRLNALHPPKHGELRVTGDTVYIFDEQYGWCHREAYDESPTPAQPSFWQKWFGWLRK